MNYFDVFTVAYVAHAFAKVLPRDYTAALSAHVYVVTYLA